MDCYVIIGIDDGVIQFLFGMRHAHYFYEILCNSAISWTSGDGRLKWAGGVPNLEHGNVVYHQGTDSST